MNINSSETSTVIRHRSEAGDALEAVLPFDRRDFLDGLLTDDDVEALRQLAKEGIGANCSGRCHQILAISKPGHFALLVSPSPGRHLKHC